MLTDTITKEVFVDNITEAGSAFGATGEGEAVFINARIVNAVKIKEGDHVQVLVLPNYEDKREKVKWRAVRAEVQGSMTDPVPAEGPVQLSNDKRIVALLEEYGPMRTSSLSRLLGIDVGEAGALCHGLFAQGKIALADVYSSPANTRASHRVWGININDFDVDPFDAGDDD